MVSGIDRCKGCGDEIAAKTKKVQVRIATWGGTHNFKCHPRCAATLVKWTDAVVVKHEARALH